MKRFLTAIALISLLTIPALESANAALFRRRAPHLATTATDKLTNQPAFVLVSPAD
jgi:hypothetical protein